MGVYVRPDSRKWYWLCLERPGQRPIREKTRIPIDGPTRQARDWNRMLAEQAYVARMGQLAQARYALPVERPVMPFATFADWYEAHISTTKRNLARERSMLKALRAHFGDRALSTITREACLEWRTARRAQVGPRTVNRELDLLRHLFQAAVPAHLETNPAAKLGRLRAEEVEVRLLDPDEETRLFAQLDAEDQAVVLCALDTLLRLSSVVGLKRAQDHGTFLTALNPKTRGYRVPVSTRLRAALDALPADRGEWVFPRYNPEGLSAGGRRNLVIRMFGAACGRAGIPYGRPDGVTFHALRHTGASRMLAAGVDVQTVRQLGGWANLSVLTRYLHPTDEARRLAVEAIGKAASA